jgi:hypothetical protein
VSAGVSRIRPISCQGATRVVQATSEEAKEPGWHDALQMVRVSAS